MLKCKQNLVKFCPFVLKILSGNENYDGITELQKDRQGKSSIAPTFSKRGYNEITIFVYRVLLRDPEVLCVNPCHGIPTVLPVWRAELGSDKYGFVHHDLSNSLFSLALFVSDTA